MPINFFIGYTDTIFGTVDVLTQIVIRCYHIVISAVVQIKFIGGQSITLCLLWTIWVRTLWISHPPYTTIEPKQRASNDEFLSLEPSIWKEFGEVLQELVQKMEEEINCHDFYISVQVGKENKLIKNERIGEKVFLN